MFRLFLCVVLLMAALPMIFIGTRSVDGERVPFRVIGGFLLVFGLLFGAWSTVRVVAPGQVGIPELLGSVKDPIGPGVHLVNPFATVHKMNLRTQTYTMSVSSDEGDKHGDDAIDVNTKDGASVRVDATIVYHLEKGAASGVFRKLGTSYTELLRSTSRTAIRGAFGNFEAVPAATTERKKVSSAIEEELRDKLGVRGLNVEDFQLRNVILPEQLQQAVSRKLAIQQQAQQQEYALLKAQKQADIRRAEAQGLADAQRIINSTLTPEYLQYLYTQNLEKMSKSPNHSTIIVPFDKNLTPLLNIGDK